MNGSTRRGTTSWLWALPVLVLVFLVLFGGLSPEAALGAVIGVLLVSPFFLINYLRWRRANAALGPGVVMCVALLPELHYGFLALDGDQLHLHGMKLESLGSWPLTGLLVSPDVPVRSGRSRRGFRLNTHPPVDLVCMGKSGWITRRQSDAFLGELAARGVALRE